MALFKKNKEFVEIQNTLKSLEIEQQNQTSLIQLLKMFDNGIYLPMTRWSLPPRELLHICNDILFNKRKMVIEFGTGYSTIIICKLIKMNNLDVEFVSIDNSKSWQKSILNILSKLDLSGLVKLVEAPLVEVDKDIRFSNQKKWYDINILNKELELNSNIDLIIVDAPFGGASPYVRYSAVPYLKNKLADDYAIFIDNTDRDEEKKIVESWCKLLNCNFIDHTNYSYLTSISKFVTAPYSVKPKGW